MATTQAMPTPFPSTPPRPVAPTTTAATALPASPPARARSARGPALLALVVAFAIVGYAGARLIKHERAPAAATPSAPAPALAPRLGLETLARYGDEATSGAALSPGEWETAAFDFERAAQQAGAPKRWVAAHLHCIGMRDLAHGKLDAAERSLRAATAHDAAFALPHVGLSALLVRQGKLDDAIRAAQTAQSLAPDLVVAIAAAGRAYAAAGRNTDAIEQFRRALAKSPGPGLRAQLALAYHHAGFDDAALREASEALKGDPDNVMSHVLVAERALEDGDGKRAFEHTERAVAVEPRNAAAWLAHGDALLLLRREVEAKKALTEALRLWGETKQVGAPVARLALVKTALAAGKLPELRGAGRASPCLLYTSPSPRD